MFFFDDIKYMKLYKKKVQLPINLDDKLHGSVVQVFSPISLHTLKLLNSPLISTRYYNSYFVEKDMIYYINNEGTIYSDSLRTILESEDGNTVNTPTATSPATPVLYEPKVVRDLPLPGSITKIKNRNRNYKLMSKKAIYRINKAMDSAMSVDDTVMKKDERDIDRPESKIESGYLQIAIDGDNYLVCTPDSLDVLKESKDPTSTKLYKILYNDRFKNNRGIVELHKECKDKCPFITKTYIDINRYKQLNLIVDYGIYNEIFFKNNIYKLDKAVDLYLTYMKRLLLDKRLDDAGYTKKTIMIPVDAWAEYSTKILNYRNDINPISVIFRTVKHNPNRLKDFGDSDFVFFTDRGYFKCKISSLELKDLAKLTLLFNKLLDTSTVIQDDEPTKVDSKTAIIANIVDKIEASQNVTILNIKPSTEEEKNAENLIVKPKTVKHNLTGTATEDSLKRDLVDRIDDIAKTANSEDDALDSLNDQEIKGLIMDLATNSKENIKISAAHATRVSSNNDSFLHKEINNKSIRDIISIDNTQKPLPVSTLKVDSVNEEWAEIKSININKVYDPDADILAALTSFGEKSLPVSLLDVQINDSSTSEDYKDTWIVKCEDGIGQRFTLTFDIPKFKDNNFMRLRGNDKTINSQMFRLPITKSDSGDVQLVSNYNKIFVRLYGGDVVGRSYPTAGRMIKTLDSYKGFKIVYGDNSKISRKYELPIDYIDLGSAYTSIETKDAIYIFNQDLIREKYKNKIDLAKGLPIGINKADDSIIYYIYNNFSVSDQIHGRLCEDREYERLFKTKPMATKYAYSKASILNTEIPIIILMAYAVGLEEAMKTANIIYYMTEKLPKYDRITSDCIRFKDGYIIYDLSYTSSLLMNGLKECDTANYSITEIASRDMYLDFLDQFGGRIKSDGLDNYYELFIDPITKSVCEKYKLPSDYVSQLAHANALLADNKYLRHGDTSAYRYRRNELVAGYAYKVLAYEYGSYRTRVKKTGKGTMTLKKTAIIDAILEDNNTSDFSYINDLNVAESLNAISTKGLSGMNSERSYTLDKRSYDESMINILGMSTGFAATVGISRQTTVDMNVDTTRGYFIQSDPKKDVGLKSLTITEALTPLSSTMDDPFRQAMNFIQTNKHTMRTKYSSPMLITNGTDQALPYMTGNMFSHKAKTDGEITAITDEYMIIKYNDGTSDFVNLSNQVKKNSDAGIYTNLKLDTNKKVGQHVKANDVVAYDKLSYSNNIGQDNNLTYNNGTLAKIAILNTDEGFEDSAIISDWMAEALSSEVVLLKDVTLPKTTNILSIVSKGDLVQEGDPLIIFQNAVDDEDANLLLKQIADEEGISDIGRIPVRSKVTGRVQDIKIYRTVEKDELSTSLRKLVDKNEKPISDMEKIMRENNITDKSGLDPNYRLDPIGKLKNAKDGVRIEFYLTYDDRMSIGDKIVYHAALKGVVKDIFPIGKEPYTELRPNEKIESFLALGSPNGRMTCSVFEVGAVNKAVIELDRSIKDILEIPWTDMREY